jgi:predicted transcriptional regulator
MKMAEPKTVTLSLNDIIKGVVDSLQASKSIVVNVGQGGVDFLQEGANKANDAIDEAIDALQKMISD